MLRTIIKNKMSLKYELCGWQRAVSYNRVKCDNIFDKSTTSELMNIYHQMKAKLVNKGWRSDMIVE